MYPPPGVRNGDRPARAAADTGDSCSSGVPDFDLRTDFAVVRDYRPVFFHNYESKINENSPLKTTYRLKHSTQRRMLHAAASALRRDIRSLGPSHVTSDITALDHRHHHADMHSAPVSLVTEAPPARSRRISQSGAAPCRAGIRRATPRTRD